MVLVDIISLVYPRVLAVLIRSWLPKSLLEHIVESYDEKEISAIIKRNRNIVNIPIFGPNPLYSDGLLLLSYEIDNSDSEITRVHITWQVDGIPFKFNIECNSYISTGYGEGHNFVGDFQCTPNMKIVKKEYADFMESFVYLIICKFDNIELFLLHDLDNIDADRHKKIECFITQLQYMI